MYSGYREDQLWWNDVKPFANNKKQPSDIDNDIYKILVKNMGAFKNIDLYT